MKFYDLFCGIGGFRLGFEGHEHVGSCEINEYARKIYCKNFGAEPTEKDVRMVEPSRLPDFDILTAGFPCQAFSIAGKRMGFTDTRGTMFFEICRIIKEKRPKTLLLENVKGLLNHDRGRTFTTILNTLYELGYDVEWQVINGKYFVPQNRERVFIIGHTRDKPFRQIFPLGCSYQVNDEPQSEKQGEGKRFRDAYSRTIDSSYYKGWGGGRTMIQVMKDVYDPSGISPCMLTMGGGENRIKIVMPSHTKANIKQRIQDSDKTWTLDTSGRKMGVFVKDKIRCLTPLECERLMGFPDGWTDGAGISNTQRYRCLGNAVIPAVVSYIVKNLK